MQNNNDSMKKQGKGVFKVERGREGGRMEQFCL